MQFLILAVLGGFCVSLVTSQSACSLRDRWRETRSAHVSSNGAPITIFCVACVRAAFYKAHSWCQKIHPSIHPS
jgi:hypothetical protein